MSDGALENIDLLVADNIRILTLPSRRFERSLAIVLVGPPFAGKTKLVEYLVRQLPLVHLSEENMASFLAPRATFFKRGAEEIFLLASKTIEALIKQNVCTIYDASVKKRSDRALLRKLVEGAGGRLLVVHIIIPEEDMYETLEVANAQIVRGDRKGFIMDKDLMRYEINSIDVPGEGENPIVYKPKDFDAKQKIENKIRAILGS